ncbi:flavin reductase family protein [Kitasatospora sp. NPDC101155]|uniref:flavin reductase family protein n=1 Tax=Kitasatospora sp. NPDC101155 TaxID=3364097 RepID=UPI00381081CC
MTGLRQEKGLLVVPSQQQEAQDRAIEPRALRDVCGLFVTGVTVITSGDGEGVVGATVNSFTSVSLDPPMVLFCLHRDSRIREVVRESNGFVVNFLTGRQESLAWAFAGRRTASFEGVAHHHSERGMPVLSEALAYLSCRLVNEFDGGDHTIFLGEVVDLGEPRRNHDPLIFFRGSMGALEDEPKAFHPIMDG